MPVAKTRDKRDDIEQRLARQLVARAALGSSTTTAIEIERHATRTIIEWLADAERLRASFKNTQRRLLEWARRAGAPPDHGWDAVSFALRGATLASGNSTPDAADFKAVSDSLRDMREATRGHEPARTALIVAYAAFVYRRGGAVDRLAAATLTADGKTNMPRRVAVFALADLGLGTAAIQRALQKHRGVIDGSEIRRLLRIRAANS